MNGLRGSQGATELVEPTRAAPAAVAPEERAKRRASFVRVAGSGVQTQHDLEDLLRRRLRGLSLFFLCASLVGVPVAMGSVLPQTSFDWRILTMSSPMLLAAAVVAGIVWSRRRLSLRVLRGVELVLFGVAWLVLLRMEAANVADGALLWHVERGTNLRLLAGATAVTWVGPILAYGVLIPNTWPRCAAVVVGFALTPLVVYGFGAWRADLLGLPIVRIFLVELAFWLSLAPVIAIYGSHRIEVLRQQAAEARRLGHYELKRLLGSGGMGEVYLAEHALLRRPCAVKLIRPERCGANELRRFEREVQTTATLTHPNTIQIFDYGHAQDGTFYYVMEYLPGLTLEQLVGRHGALPAARAVHFLRQVCGALREAHAVGLVHRDLKPGNIMICERGGQHDVAKLLDFGLVQALGAGADGEKLTQEGTITGTPAYMSPEQSAGRDDLDGRSDIYSLGCVAYFALTGQPPFGDRSPVRVLAAHLYERVTFPADRGTDAPEKLREVVLRCVAKDPAERFADVASLDRALGECEAGVWSEEDAAAWWQQTGGTFQRDGSPVG